MTNLPDGYFKGRPYYYKSNANDASQCSYATRDGAERAQRIQQHPDNWYVWQMNDGSWHISLLANRDP